MLEKVTLQVGIPLQIVGDSGSNLKKGIKLISRELSSSYLYL
jgi:hypothetical protein